MSTIFCWKECSSEILNMCYKENRSCAADDKFCLSKDEEDDDISDVDNKIFERATRIRRTSLKLFPETDNRLQRWIDLTDAVKAPSRRHSFFGTLEPVRPRDDAAISKQSAILKHVPPILEPGKLEHRKNSRECGQLKLTFKFQYLIMTERLKVTVVKVSNLFSDGASRNRLSANVDVCLMPGKQGQHSTPLRFGQENPVFNTVMFFTGFSLEEILHLKLRLRVNGRGNKRSSSMKLGESTVTLRDFDIIGETVLEQLIETK